MALLLSQFGGVASHSTYLTNSFDALAIGWRAEANISASAIDINQITINVVQSEQPTGNPVLGLPLNLVMQVVGNQIQLSWPADHLGWQLQMQTNDLATPASALIGSPCQTPATSSPGPISTINQANGSIFFRLIYP